MSKTSVIIEIPKPCAENWDAMTPTERGRHCALCQKQVIDFTGFTDRELQDFMVQQPAQLCGRFTEWQLGRELIVPEEHRQSLYARVVRRVAASVLLVQALAAEVSAQDSKPKTENGVVINNQRTITGCVTDYMTGAPLEGIQVSVTGSAENTITNKDGFFSMHVPVTPPGTRAEVTAGYTTQSPPGSTIILPVTVPPDSAGKMPELMIYRYPLTQGKPVKITAYKRPRVTAGDVSPRVNIGAREMQTRAVQAWPTRIFKRRHKQ